MEPNEEKELEKELEKVNKMLKEASPIVATNALRVIVSEVNRLTELEKKSKELYQEAVAAQQKESYTVAAGRFWLSYAVIHNNLTDKYVEAKTLMLVGGCLFRSRMYLLSLVYFNKAIDIFTEEKAKGGKNAANIERELFICVEYLNEIRELYPFYAEEVERVRRSQEYTSATSCFTDFSRDSIPYYNFGLFLIGKSEFRKITDIPKKEIAMMYEEASRVFLEVCKYENALKNAQDAKSLYDLIKDSHNVKRMENWIKQIEKIKKEKEKQTVRQ